MNTDDLSPHALMSEAQAYVRQQSAWDPLLDVRAAHAVSQGKNNIIIPVCYGGCPAVLKYFDDRINKKQSQLGLATEVLALRHFATVPMTPDCLAVYDKALVMTYIPYRSLARSCQQQAPCRQAWDGLGGQLGQAYGQMAACDFDDGTKHPQCTGPAWTWHDQAKGILAQARCICEASDCLRPYADGFGILGKYFTQHADDRLCLYRYDNNFANILVDDTQDSGTPVLKALVDFEMTYLGTEDMVLGALMDTLAEIYPAWQGRPSWSSIAMGYQTVRQLPNWEQRFQDIVAMAEYNHWLRIVQHVDERGELGGMAERFSLRFPVLRKLYQSGSHAC